MSAQRKKGYLIAKVGIDYQERRSHKRDPGMLTGCLIHGADGRLAGCQLLNVSAGGAMVKLDRTLDDEMGANLSLGLRLRIAAGGDHPVEVVWQDGPVVGLRFLNDPDQTAAVVAKALTPGWARLRG